MHVLLDTLKFFLNGYEWMSEWMRGMVKQKCLIKTVVEFIRLRIYAERALILK